MTEAGVGVMRFEGGERGQGIQAATKAEKEANESSSQSL